MIAARTAEVTSVIDRSIPVLPCTNFEKTARLFRAIGFDVAVTGSEWLYIRRGAVEIDYSASGLDWASPELELVDRPCLVRVESIVEWHERLSNAKVRWKMMGAPSLTSVSTAAWHGAPAFCLTDHDRNVIWFVQSGGAAR